ncbi:MAG: DUF4349 domain-containing protein [Dehalococcoidia bacterium]
MNTRNIRTWSRRSRLAALLVASIAVASMSLVACAGSDDADDSGSLTSGESRGSIGVAQDAPAAAPAADGSFGFPGGGGAMAESAVDASAPNAPGTGGSFDLLGRSIIRSGSVDMQVTSVAEAFEQVTSVATGAGGFVASSQFFGSGDEQTAYLTVRVPSDRFDSVLEQLRGLAVEVDSISTNSEDVTGEVTDLESSLRNLRAVEAQYIELLGRANAIGDVLQVQDRLNQTRLQIDQIEGRIQVLGRLSDLATLSVQLRPEAAAPVVENEGGLSGAVSDAWQASLNTLENIATVALVVVVYSWWLVPVLVLGGFVLRRWLRSLGSDSTPPLTSIDTPQGTA